MNNLSKIMIVGFSLWVLMLQGCTSSVGSNPSYNAYGMKKDVVVTFPAWTSYNSKYTELLKQSKTIASRKCGYNKKYNMIEEL